MFFKKVYVYECLYNINKLFNLKFELVSYSCINNFIVLSLKIPFSIGYDDILNYVDKIRTVFIYPIVLSRDFKKFNRFYIYVNLNNEDYIKFENYNTEKVHVGYDMFCNPLLLDFSKNPHLLIAGDTGSGKTCLLSFIVEGLLLNKSRVYMFQARKRDLSKYKDNCEVYFTLEDIFRCLSNVYKILLYRETNFSRMENIYLIFEEFSALTVKSSDLKATKEIKNKILDILVDIALMGRTLHIYLIITVQKATNDMIPSAIKNQLKNRIALKIEDQASSTSVLGNGNACNLVRGFGILKNEIEQTFIIAFTES